MYFDVERYVDLNCLDLIDAQAITKQKVYDVAQIARKQFKYSKTNKAAENECLILII